MYRALYIYTLHSQYIRVYYGMVILYKYILSHTNVLVLPSCTTFSVFFSTTHDPSRERDNYSFRNAIFLCSM